MGWEARRWLSTWPARRTAALGIEWPCSLTQATSAPSVRATRSPRARSPPQTDTAGLPVASAIASSSFPASTTASTGPGTGSRSSRASGGTPRSTAGA